MRRLQVMVPPRVVDGQSGEAAPTEPPPSCPLCLDRGWVLEADGGAGSASQCECRRRDLGPRLLAACGIPPRYAGCSLGRFSTAHEEARIREQLQRARVASQRYVEEFLRPDGSFADGGLIFVGPTGTGKTHLACSILTELIQRYRVRGRFIEFTALIHQIQATFRPNSPLSKGGILDPILSAELLVIDELGAQKPSAWVQDLLYLIINGRYTARLPTLFTTNHPLAPPAGERRSLDRGAEAGGGLSSAPEPLSHRMQSTLVSRLCEMAKPIILDSAGDYRRDILMQRRRL